MAKPNARHAWSTLSRTGQIFGPRACAIGWRRVGPLSADASDGESEMLIDGEALPLSRGQLDIWLSQESGFAGTEWQLGLLGRIAGAVDHDLLQQAIRQAMFEAEPARAAFFEIDGQVFQKVTDYSDLELPFFDVSDSDDPVQRVREAASSIQRTPMPLTGRLVKFALFRTGPDEYYLFGLCHHISLDGLGIALVSRRIATIYSGLVSGAPITPAYFGTLRDLVE